jgi:hypothetical protein
MNNVKSWRTERHEALERARLFDDTLVALDAAKMEARASDSFYAAQHIEHVLLPFIEDERDRAKLEADEL